MTLLSLLGASSRLSVTFSTSWVQPGHGPGWAIRFFLEGVYREADSYFKNGTSAKTK